jgi:hypothetical protein
MDKKTAKRIERKLDRVLELLQADSVAWRSPRSTEEPNILKNVVPA